MGTTPTHFSEKDAYAIRLDAETLRTHAITARRIVGYDGEEAAGVCVNFGTTKRTYEVYLSKAALQTLLEIVPRD